MINGSWFFECDKDLVIDVFGNSMDLGSSKVEVIPKEKGVSFDFECKDIASARASFLAVTRWLKAINNTIKLK